MEDMRCQRTRWKGRNASETASADPMSALYDSMKSWIRPVGMLAGSAVLLPVNYEQAQLLNRACFGRQYPPPVTQAQTSASSYPPPVAGFDDDGGGIQMFQLGLEEAFFLSYELRCIEICQQAAKGRIPLNHDELWILMQRKNKKFVLLYKAYSHMRFKRWVVLSGIQFGADFMAYRHHPALVHSDYAVLVISGGELQSRVSTWTDLHAMGRLCGSVAKTLLLLHILPRSSRIDCSLPLCLGDYDVEPVELHRWIPEKNREAEVSSEEMGSQGSPIQVLDEFHLLENISD